MIHGTDHVEHWQVDSHQNAESGQDGRGQEIKDPLYRFGTHFGLDNLSFNEVHR